MKSVITKNRPLFGEMVAGGDHFFQLESFLNPSGSRSLEFDPQIAINP
jgi:hypothetical protein